MSRSTPRVRPRPPTEHAEQVALVYQVRSHRDRWPALRAFAAVPNQGGADLYGGKKGAIIRGVRMKQEGLAPGYPDALLDVARCGWHGLRLELKRSATWSRKFDRPTREGRPTDDQHQWLVRLTMNGYLCFVAWGWEPAWAILQWYVTLPDRPLGPGEQMHVPDFPRARLYVRPAPPAPEGYT